jgi:hypothetical protein
MTSFPGSPRLVKGAIVGVDAMNPLASVVVFQYNPDTMTRRREAEVRKTIPARSVGRRTIELAGEACVNQADFDR